MECRTEIREFVHTLVSDKGNEVSFSDSDYLVTNGFLDSMDVLQIILFLEEKYDIDFNIATFDVDQFDSVDGIVEVTTALTA